MTWGELKKSIEDAGVKDEDPIWYIDVHDYIAVIEKDEHLGWQVW